MADERSLLRPLRADSLRPRPSTQAVWEPGKPEPLADRPAADAVHTFAPEVRFEPHDQPEEALSDLDAVIASILDADEEDEDASAQDALPTEKMPMPAFVPLYETPAVRPKSKGWIWFIAAAAVTLAAGCAAGLLGWLR